jgi:hypothetical protein
MTGNYVYAIIATQWADPNSTNGFSHVYTTTPKTLYTDVSFPAKGEWVLARQLAFKDEYDLLAQITDTVKITMNLRDLTVLPNVEEGGAFCVRKGSAATNDWEILRTAIINYNSRNVFLFMHGGPNTLGGYTNAADTRGLKATQIRHDLNNEDVLQSNRPDRQKYRFVFLDACESAGGDWPLAFGIKKNVYPEDTIHYADTGFRPQVFVGWKNKKMIEFNDEVQVYHIDFINTFWTKWFSEYRGLKRALQEAAAHPDSSGINFKSMQIYGYEGLHWDEGNQ